MKFGLVSCETYTDLSFIINSYSADFIFYVI